MRRRAGKCWKHKVTEAKKRQASNWLFCCRWTEDKEEKLNNVVIALKVA